MFNSRKMIYDKLFFDSFDDIARQSAATVVPEVRKHIDPASVIDVGCGRGYWLAEFGRHGVTSLLGLDGGRITPSDLVIPLESFRSMDFSELGLGTLVEMADRFDLAICLEVAEHLAAPLGEKLVAALCRLAPVVLFSAGIPGQEATGHINLQWPRYWAELFRRHGFGAVDCLRLTFWADERVGWWYRQNMMFMVETNRMKELPTLPPLVTDSPLSLVHPLLYESRALEHQNTRDVLAVLPRLIRESVGYRTVRLCAACKGLVGRSTDRETTPSDQRVGE
jgi:SAM-dependent methyltransferase